MQVKRNCLAHNYSNDNSFLFMLRELEFIMSEINPYDEVMATFLINWINGFKNYYFSFCY